MKEHLERIRSLPPNKRIAYIREYYWLWIVGILGGCVFLTYVLFHAFFSVKEFWFYAVFANTMEDAGDHSLLWDDFLDYTGYNVRQKKVEFNGRSFFDPSKSGGTSNSYFQAFAALVESGDLDVVTMGEEGLEAVGASGRLLDLNREECASIREKYVERFVYCIPYDEEYSTEPVPVGIDLSDSSLVTKYHIYEDDCVLGISAYTQRLDAVEQFLAFVLEES